MLPDFQCRTIYNSQDMDATSMSKRRSDNRILVTEKNEIMSFAATWKDLEIISLSEVSQTGNDKYQMISLICGI